MISSNVAELQYFATKYKELSKLKYGQTLTKDGDFVKIVEPSPNLLSRTARALYRSTAGESTEFDIGLLKNGCEKTRKLVTETTTPFNTDDLQQLYRLRKYLARFLESEKTGKEATGIEAYIATSMETPADLYTKPEATQQKRKASIEEIAKLLKEEVLPKVTAIIEGIEKAQKPDETKELVLNLVQKKPIPTDVKVPLVKVKEELAMLYSKKAVDAAILRYHLTYKGMLDKNDVAALIIGIVSNLDPEDYIQILNSPKTSICNRKYSAVEKVLPKRLQDLNHDQTCATLGIIRDVQIDGVEGKDRKYADQLAQDKVFLKATSEGLKAYLELKPQALRELKHFAWAEYLCETVKTLYFTQKTQYSEAAFIPSLDLNSNPRFLNIHTIFRSVGLNIMGLFPYSNDKQEIVTMHLVVNSPDGQPVSKEIFQKNAEEISTKLSGLIGDTWSINEGKKVRIDIICQGTSARYGQECAALLSDMLVKLPDFANQVCVVQMYAFNPVGLDKKTAETSLQALEAAKIPFYLRYFVSAPKKEGNVLLGYNEKGDLPSNIKVALYDIDFKLEQPKTPKPLARCLVVTDKEVTPILNGVFTNNKLEENLAKDEDTTPEAVRKKLIV